jgi:hypothetical protein
MTVCTQGWTYENSTLLLRGTRPSRPALEQALAKYEKEGCSCGRALDCPLMAYLLNDDGGDESITEMVEPKPPFELVNLSESSNHEPEPNENDSEWDNFSPNPRHHNDDDDEEDWDSDDDEEDEIDMSNYDFSDDGSYKPNPMTSFNEKDLVNDVFKPASQIYQEEQDTLNQSGARQLYDEIDEQAAKIGSFADTTIRMQQDNRVLREKLSEMELQVNQQLREIATRQQQQGDVEKMISDTKRVNKDLIWSITACLKMLKFLPDSSKMNFRNSRDFKRMLEIYKEHVEPHKEEIR